MSTFTSDILSRDSPIVKLTNRHNFDVLQRLFKGDQVVLMQ